MAFDRHFVEDVRRTVNVLAEFGRYVELKKSGSRWKGKCPFHQEKTPSFYVDESLGLYKCFGCGAGGDLFRFIMELEHVTFPEAVEILARRYGMNVPDFRSEEKGPRRAEIEQVLQDAVEFYHRSLYSAAHEVREYLLGRSLSEEIWKRWKLGWAPGGNALLNYLKPRYPEPLLTASGVIQESERGAYDFFRERLLIPLYSGSGRLVGLSGRSLQPDTPKYINSRESAYFQKRDLLFAYDRARKEAGRRGEWILVEGYFDCIQAHEAGIGHAVATMGTALTARHGVLLKRVAERAVVCFDGDEAGRSAAEKAISILLSAGLDVDVLFLPEGEDPDDYIVQHGGDAFEHLLSEGRMSFFEFLWEREFPEGARRLPPIEKSRKVRKILDMLNNMQDRIMRYEYLSRLSGQVEIPVNVLARKSVGKSTIRETVKPEKQLPDMERKLAALLLQNPSLQSRYRDRIREELFLSDSCRVVIRILREIDPEGKGVDILTFSTHLIERGGDQSLLSEFQFLDVDPGQVERYFLHLEEKYYARELKEVQEKLEQEEGDRVEELLAKKQSLSSLLLQTRKKREEITD